MRDERQITMKKMEDEMSEQEPTYPVIPLLRDGQGRPFFEYLLWPYYAEAFGTLVERQRKYGPENIAAAGVAGVLEQARNKIERASAQLTGSVVNGKIVLDEMDGETRAVLHDSLLDLANYALITLALAEGNWVREMVLHPDRPTRPWGLDVEWMWEDPR
jgi:hypothetical protein